MYIKPEHDIICYIIRKYYKSFTISTRNLVSKSISYKTPFLKHSKNFSQPESLRNVNFFKNFRHSFEYENILTKKRLFLLYLLHRETFHSSTKGACEWTQN